jgi:nitrite reductase/ring-hydroxylating ferredoxin subunit
MSVTYRAVGWNANKRRYDVVAAACVATYLIVFGALHAWLQPAVTIETLLIRASGSAALLLLHVILAVGPLARLDARCLPLLYNRRHLGVLMFLLAASHGVFAIVQFHGGGTLHPIVSVLTGDRGMPFQSFGLAALILLLCMAATSHDFWLHQLTAPVWKALHQGVYLAYACLVLHVAFGVLQGEATPVPGALLALGATILCALHGLTGWRERRLDRERRATSADGFVDVCDVDDIPERRAVITCLSGERVAVFRYDGRLAALSNVCQHQNGPLGEGRIVNDCVVCPWHGYEYLPETGASPAPFTEKVPTFSVRLDGRRVLVHPRPHPPGTRVPPTLLSGAQSHG